MLSIIKKHIPISLKNFLKNIQNRYRIFRVEKIHSKLIQKVKLKNKIRIAFLLVDESIWKYNHIYRLFENNARYELAVFNCPNIKYGEKLMHERMNCAFESFKTRGYNILSTQKENGEWMDVKEEYRPDLVFFCTPWSHTISKYQIENFLDTLSIYIPYGFKNSNLYEHHFNRNMMNFTWRFFIETDIHATLSQKYALNRGRNTIVTGFPGMDVFLDPSFKANGNIWKSQNIEKKKIIWAPHHTIPGASNALNYSTFLEYSEFMIELAKEFEDEIQIAFKPHPVLKKKLNDIWGVEKTDSYYNKWRSLSNTQLEDGEYIDLFATSDAMIHDSGSFVIEYLYTKKPVMFLISSEKVKEEFNEIGIEALKNMDLGYNENDIRKFIKETILENKDEFKEKRDAFFKKLVKPPNDKMASENIYDYLVRVFDNNKG